MTALADAFARARRNTKAERRALKSRVKSHEKSQELCPHWFEHMSQDAQAIDTINSLPPDKGLDDHIVVQAIPLTKLERPSFPGIRTQAFAKTSQSHDQWQVDQIVLRDRVNLQRHFHPPISKQSNTIGRLSSVSAMASAEKSLQRICDEQDKIRADQEAHAHALALLNSAIDEYKAQQDAEAVAYMRQVRPRAQARAWQA